MNRKKIKSIVKDLIPNCLYQNKLNSNNSILFTFDDGPHAEITPLILDILDQYDAKALFFIEGRQIVQAPAILNEIIDRGHGLGNHSINHEYCNKLNFKELKREIKGCSQLIYEETSVLTTFFRPPFGVMDYKTFLATKLTKHSIMGWSLDTGEYNFLKNATSNELAESFMTRVNDRDIVLAHDNHSSIPDFLRIVLPKLLDLGYDLSAGIDSVDWCANQ